MNGIKQKLGWRGEEIACAYLTDKGYRLVCRNYRLRYGEIDLVMYDADILVFVEVRSKTKFEHGTPLETVDYKKRRQIERMARHYLARNKISEDVRCRFDLVGVRFECSEDKPLIEHVENAFVAGE